MTSRVWRAASWFFAGVQKSQTPFGSGVFQPWPSSMPQGWTMITAVSAARRRLGISMMPRALYENRQARTCRSAPSSSTSSGASNRATSRTGSTNSGWSASSGFGSTRGVSRFS